MSKGKSPIDISNRMVKLNFNEFDDDFIEQIHGVGYHPIRKLGEGTYGKVIEVVGFEGMGSDGTPSLIEEDGHFAMKLMKYNLDKVDVNIETNSSFTEAYFTKMFRHPNIVNRREFGYIEGYSYYCMDLADGDLSKNIGDLTIETIYEYAHSLADAIHYIHRAGFLHCDVKTLNVLLFNGVAKLSDLGFLRVEENSDGSLFPSSICQTLNYRAPEQYINNEYSISSYVRQFGKTSAEGKVEKGEYWSLGIVILDMLYGIPFVTFHGTQPNYGGYHYLLTKMSRDREAGKSVMDSIIDVFGQPKDLPLLEITCRHLLDLDVNKRNIVAFMEDSLFLNKDFGMYRTPFVPPSVSNMYLGSKDEIPKHRLAIKWMVEVAVDMKIPLFTVMNAIDFYIQHCHEYSKKEYQLLAIVSFWLVDQIFVPTAYDINIRDLIYYTDDTYTFQQFVDMVNDIQTTYDGYPMFESLYFHLPSMDLVVSGFKRMLRLTEYINYRSPRYLADMLIADESEDDKAHRLKRFHVKTNEVIDAKEVDLIDWPARYDAYQKTKEGSKSLKWMKPATPVRYGPIYNQSEFGPQNKASAGPFGMPGSYQSSKGSPSKIMNGNSSLYQPIISPKSPQSPYKSSSSKGKLTTPEDKSSSPYKSPQSPYTMSTPYS